MNTKMVGGILLIVGTSIGGGMLALPVSTAEAGYWNSIIFLILCWLVMTIGAFLILEVNMRLPIGSNMVSMAKATLGFPGEIVAWGSYLLLLYTLMAAYISGGGDIFCQLLSHWGFHLPGWNGAILFAGLFSVIVYQGIQVVDYFNRIFMFCKLGVYLLLAFTISPFIHVEKWSVGSSKAVIGSIMVLMTSFGFATIVPSLRAYFNNDVKALRKVIFWGSFIPLICYIIWNALIMGVIARDGRDGLMVLATTDHMTSGLNTALSLAIHSSWISAFFNFFTSICMVTTFLGVSIGLFDFLADGLRCNKGGVQGRSLFVLTFLPPLMIVIFNPGIYLHALSYAGICCVILLLFLPSLMAWSARVKQLHRSNNDIILVPGGYPLLVVMMIVSVSLLILPHVVS